VKSRRDAGRNRQPKERLAEASEIMAVVQTAMLGGMLYPALRAAIFARPTAAEGCAACSGMFPPSPNRARTVVRNGAASYRHI
jgi:hypothetical protein